jgi:hypothetical protein
VHEQAKPGPSAKKYIRTESKQKFMVIKRPYTDEGSECAHTSTSLCKEGKVTLGYKSIYIRW